MKNLVLLAVGVAAGFVAAHVVSRTPEGRAFFDTVDARANQFRQSVVDGYHAREEEIRDAVAKARAAFDDLNDRS